MESSRRRCLGLAFCVSFLLTQPLASQPVRLVADLPSDFRVNNLRPDVAAELDGELYFWHLDPTYGWELWKTDGTVDGTAILKDICPGRCDSKPHYNSTRAVVGDLLFFEACDGARGCHLWRTDGTSVGTLLVETFEHIDSYDGLGRFTSVNGRFLFRAADPVHGFRTFTSDGTAAGTRIVEDEESKYSLMAIEARSHAFLVGEQELWVSDGTEAGTRQVLKLDGDQKIRLAVGPFAVIGDQLIFRVRSLDEGTHQIWRSDGTSQGTLKILDVDYRRWLLAATVGDVAFLWQALSDDQRDLWKTDGTTEGTVLVKAGFGRSDTAVSYRGKLFFDIGSELWRSDGSTAGTVLVSRFNAAILELVAGSDALYVMVLGFRRAGDEVWQTQGTIATTEINRAYPKGTRLEELRIIGDRLYAITRGVLSWLDPAEAEPVPLTPVDLPESGDPVQLTALGDRLVFATERSVFDLLDTEQVPLDLGVTIEHSARIVPAGSGAFVFDTWEYYDQGPAMWFVDDYRQATPLVSDGGPWVSADFSVADGEDFYFLVDFANNGHEVWQSDGSLAGTQAAVMGLPALDDPCGDVGCGIPRVRTLSLAGRQLVTTVQNRLFRADPEDGSFETLLDLDEVNSDCRGWYASSCFVYNVTPYGDEIFFTDHGRDDPTNLWASDGTAAGTRVVKQLLPEPRQFFLGAPARELTVAGGRLYFVLRTAEHGEELWASDGTGEGTVLVRDIRPGPRSSYPRELTEIDGRLVFAADDGVTGHELWTSDGTPEGTAAVADLAPGRASSFPRGLTVIDSVLVFAATDGEHGAEPWLSDLTAEGTRMIQDLHPGPAPSSPREPTVSGSRVYFNATDGSSGFELYALPRKVLSLLGRTLSPGLRFLGSRQQGREGLAESARICRGKLPQDVAVEQPGRGRLRLDSCSDAPSPTTESSANWAWEAWERSTSPRTRVSSARWRSKPCRHTWPSRPSSSGSSARPKRSRPSTIRTS